ncbi:MAG: polysaccharide deacetylase family protein, partial [Ignavibacteriales bacterium]|nr:polysaccharide deacetylase family protein [Ignavibacteriales bacterium]
NILTGLETREKTVSCILPEQQSLFGNVGLLDLFTECLIPINANELQTPDGKSTCFVGKWNEANVIVLPFDVGTIFLNKRVADKSFYSSNKRLPFEQVALVSKNSLRRLVITSLEYLHRQRNIPFVHKWYFPENTSPVFAFRIDTDYANQSEIVKLYSLSQKYQIPFTWFVDVKSQQDFLSLFARMDNQEIGIHCFEHETFSDYERNYQNIQKAKQLLQSNHIDAVGFAAPFGKWNEALGRAIQDSGFEYSSEFSYDYDNLPSFPVIDGKVSSFLQVPIHPISIGTLKRLGYSDEEMINYFRFVIEQKHQAREPIILYHHPKDGHEKVLESIFKTVQQLQLPAVRFAEYVSFWKNRGESELHTVNKCSPLPEDYLRIRKFNLWIQFIHFQDKTVGKIKKLLSQG